MASEDSTAGIDRLWQCQGCGKGCESPFAMGRCANCGGWFVEVKSFG